MTTNEEQILAEQADFLERKTRVNKAIDEMLKDQEIGLQLVLSYKEEGIVPALRFVDLKKLKKESSKQEPVLAGNDKKNGKKEPKSK
jgi:hypothetical protein